MSQGLHDVYGSFVASGFSWGRLWLRNSFSDKIFGLGSSFKHEKSDVSCEALYDYNQKSKAGLMGLPVFLRLGHSTPFGPNGVLKQTYSFGGKQWW